MSDILQQLEQVLEERKQADAETSYVASLHARGLEKILKKVGEEATETVIAAVEGRHEQVVYETADLWFHTMVMLSHLGISHREVLAELEPELQRLLLPRDPNDERNVYLEVRAGTGGAEAALFAGDLLRMYLRYAEQKRWKTETVSESPGEHGGFKEVIVRIVGQDVYARLKFESGAHRVQRVPETESQGRIHTSACTVAILPEADELDEVEINKSDLRIDTYRASGAGGQHVNKTESAVRITHNPTGVVVQCQNGRSQHQNKDQAMKQLKAKLYELEMLKRNETQQALEESKSDIGWGSQIRSYVLDQSRIKDLRTSVETSNTQAVLDGDLDQFIEASLKSGL